MWRRREEGRGSDSKGALPDCPAPGSISSIKVANGYGSTPEVRLSFKINVGRKKNYIDFQFGPLVEWRLVQGGSQTLGNIFYIGSLKESIMLNIRL